MFSSNFENQVEALLTKLCNFSGSDAIDLLQCLPYLDLTQPSSRCRFSHPHLDLTLFERHLVKGALPHCVELASIRPNTVISPINKEVEVDEAPVSYVDRENIAKAAIVPTNQSSLPPQRKTPLTAYSKEGHVVGIPEIVLSGVGRDCDLSKPASLVVSRRFLRQILLKLPRWVFWNQWTQEQKKEIKESITVEKKAKSRHDFCKHDTSVSSLPSKSPPTLQVSKQYDLDADPQYDPECTFIPKVRPYIPLYILKRPGLKKDDPLSLLRYYCKHFHSGHWIQEYEKLVDDLRECTFQPNIQKYLTNLMTKVEPPKDPFSAGDPFAALKEGFQAKKEKERQLVASGKKIKRLSSPKYRGPFARRHRDCQLSEITKMPHGHRKCQCYGVEGAATRRKEAERRRNISWELSLRNDNLRSSRMATCSVMMSKSSLGGNRQEMDPKKQRRFESQDWGKYIRLSGRHLTPVCIPDVMRLEAIVRDVSPPWEEENPKPIVVEKQGVSDSVAYLIKPSVQDYRVNQRRNFYGVVRHGVDTGELLAPLAVIGVQRDPVTDLEELLEDLTPTSLEEIISMK